MSENIDGAMTALRAERKLRKAAERESERKDVLLAQANTKIRQLSADIDQLRQERTSLRLQSERRAKALAEANKTTSRLALVLSERVSK